MLRAMDIKTLRTALGYSQAQMAQRLGVAASTVSRWELPEDSEGMRHPSRLALRQIARLERALERKQKGTPHV